MWLKIYLFLTCLIIFCSQYNLVIANPMIGEDVRQINQGEFPAVVSIKRVNNSNPEAENDHICTGTLITKQHVISAAHCERDFNSQMGEVSIGSVDIRESQRYQILWWMSYVQWLSVRQKQQNVSEVDITILKLHRAVSERIQVAKLVSRPDSYYFNKMVTAVAFGSTARVRLSRFVHAVNLKLITHTNCADQLELVRGKRFTIFEFLLCGIASPPAIMTWGNSGCPIFRNNKLLGLHKGTCPSILPVTDLRRINLFLSINFYKEYINDVITNF